jgi:hypothetical protein
MLRSGLSLLVTRAAYFLKSTPNFEEHIYKLVTCAVHTSTPINKWSKTKHNVRPSALRTISAKPEPVILIPVFLLE